MKRIILTCTLLLMCLASFSHSYKAFDKKKVLSEQGVVGLYEVEGKVYLELTDSLIGRRFLMGTMVEACSDPLESSVGYQPMAPYMVTFEKSASSIHLCRLNEAYVHTEETRPERNNISSILKSFKIQEYSSDSTAFIIDVTSYFVANDASVDPIDPKAFNAAEGFVKRTGSYVPSSSLFKGFHAGKDSFSVLVSNSYKVKASFLGVFSSGEQAILTSHVRRTFALLPEERMMPVEADPTIGTYTVKLDEYDADKTASNVREYAVRWRMAADSNRVVNQPLCFYVDTLFPRTWIPYIYEAVDEWNKAFESAGLKSALTAQPYPANDTDFHATDIRHSCIRYNLSPAERIVDSRWCDPSTGEILGAGIVVNHGIAEYIKTNLMIQTGAGNESSRRMSIDSVLFGRALKSMMLRHLGHCLGLSDNMSGSFAYPVDSLSKAEFTQKWGISASVMDELPFNFIAYSSADVQEGVVMMQEKPGIYDISTLAWLYAGKNKPEFVYGKRQSPTYFYDPRSMSFDLSHDAVESVKKGFDGLASVVEGINGWIDVDDPDYNLRNALQEIILLQAYEYMKQVFVNVGGIYINPKTAADSHPTYASVPKDIQRNHLLWALERIDDLSFLDNDVLQANSALRGDTGEFCQKYFTNFIFVQLDALWFSEVKSEDPYRLEDALADVAAHIWKGADKGKEPTDLQKYQRGMYVDDLLAWSGVRGNYYFRESKVSRENSRPDKTHIIYGFLKDTKKLLEKAIRKADSPEARNHYQYLLFRIEEFI